MKISLSCKIEKLVQDKIIKECDIFIVFPNICNGNLPSTYEFEITPIQSDDEMEIYELTQIFKGTGVPLIQEILGDFVGYVKYGAKWSEDINYNPKKEKAKMVDLSEMKVIKKKPKKKNYWEYIYGMIPFFTIFGIGFYFSIKRFKLF